jgi:hypothetical protein
VRMVCAGRVHDDVGVNQDHGSRASGSATAGPRPPRWTSGRSGLVFRWRPAMMEGTLGNERHR